MNGWMEIYIMDGWPERDIWIDEWMERYMNGWRK